MLLIALLLIVTAVSVAAWLAATKVVETAERIQRQHEAVLSQHAATLKTFSDAFTAALDDAGRVNRKALQTLVEAHSNLLSKVETSYLRAALNLQGTTNFLNNSAQHIDQAAERLKPAVLALADVADHVEQLRRFWVGPKK